jgi:hypothetical protein
MRWPHTVRVTRAGVAAGVQSSDTGAFTPTVGAERVTLYDGRGDLQQQRRSRSRDGSRDTTVISDADLFLEDERDILRLEEGANVEVTDVERSVTMTGVIVGMDDLSGRAFVGQLVVRPTGVTVANETAVLTTDDDETIAP